MSAEIAHACRPIVVVCYLLISQVNPPLQGAFECVASAARTASRVVAVTQGEKENTEDQQYQEQLDKVATAVGQGKCDVCVCVCVCVCVILSG